MGDAQRLVARLVDLQIGEIVALLRPNEAVALAGLGGGHDGDGVLIVRSQRIDWSVDGVFGVSFFGSGSDFRPRYGNLERVFGLTSTEHRVLLELLEGKEAEKIAASNRVLIATVRSHIKSIYQKLDVSSREALLHKVMPFRC